MGIAALDNPNSPLITRLDDGTTSFSFPGGFCGHYITYEVRKKDNNYYFIIHNRGSGIQDSRLHGDVEIQSEHRTYMRTRVVIQVAREALNKEFFEYLNKAFLNDNNIEGAYNKIYSHLITDNNGQIVVSGADALLERLAKANAKSLSAEVKKKVSDLILKLLPFCSNYHSIQLFGTCAESNLTEVERDMASPRVRRILKWFTINELCNLVANQHFAEALTTSAAKSKAQELEKKAEFDSAIAEHDVYMLSLEKLAKLKKKIEAPEEPPLDRDQVIKEAEAFIKEHGL